MVATVDDLSSELRKKHKIDEFYYPNISMDIEIPGGLNGEIDEIVKVLKSNRYEINVTNVFQVMEFKKDLLIRYRSSEKRRKLLLRYRELLVTKIKPVGSVVPTDLLFINGLVLVLLSIIARFGLSFADEAGKIAARKLLNDEKKEARKNNMDADEYRVIKNEVMVWLNEGTTVQALMKKIRAKKRPRKTKRKQTRPKRKSV